MTSENYKLYDLEEEIKKYTEISNMDNDSSIDDKERGPSSGDPLHLQN